MAIFIQRGLSLELFYLKKNTLVDKLHSVKYKDIMSNIKKRPTKRFINQINFEEIDHRLSCGWHVEVEESGQRKRYLRQIKSTPQVESEEKITT